MQYSVAHLGNWLGRHQKLIRYVQWFIILIYALLMIIPVFLPLPDESAALLHHFTVFAGFLFWGIWWPFVLISIMLFGRLWCGVFCPEGALSELANRYGRGKNIPKWLRWGGWPFVAFGVTTLYGQMTSVYQYPKPVLLILGGSTVLAMIIGFLYGKSSRIWCKYLCPVTGVFSLLAKLAPWRFQPQQGEWSKDQIQQIKNIHCPTLLPLSKMTGAANCLMCGKCGVAKNSIELKLRSRHEEIVVHGGKKNSFYDSLLIIFGLCGLALAAFQWPNSFWFAHFRDVLDSWLLAHQITWAFNTNVPWWVFTHYPERGDVFSWVYGFEVLIYILSVGFVMGTILTILTIFSVKMTGPLTLARFNHFSQSLIPLGGMSIFIGLFANTITLLQKYANLGFVWITEFKLILLALATVWSFVLAYKIIKNYTASYTRRALSLSIMTINFCLLNYSWILLLYVWSFKSDSIPWNAWWIPIP
jgi:polyferredoxin